MAHPSPKSALLVIDVQNDFCPGGALAVPHGTSILPPINHLLTLPFALKIGTRDWHPPNHVSFASNHASKRAFVDSVPIPNPRDPREVVTSRLWPVHCVQDTTGAQLHGELAAGRLDRVIDKGRDAGVECYSAFYAPFSAGAGGERVGDSGLLELLRKEGVERVFVVGLAADYCVKATAEDALREGFETFVVEEGTRPVDPEGGWKRDLEGKGVKVVGIDGKELGSIGERD